FVQGTDQALPKLDGEQVVVVERVNLSIGDTAIQQLEVERQFKTGKDWCWTVEEAVEFLYNVKLSRLHGSLARVAIFDHDRTRAQRKARDIARLREAAVGRHAEGFTQGNGARNGIRNRTTIERDQFRTDLNTRIFGRAAGRSVNNVRAAVVGLPDREANTAFDGGTYAIDKQVKGTHADVPVRETPDDVGQRVEVEARIIVGVGFLEF